MKSGIFRGQPSAPFREMLRLVDTLAVGERPVVDVLQELKKMAPTF